MHALRHFYASVLLEAVAAVFDATKTMRHDG